MATTTKKYQFLQKTAADEYLLLHPETDAEIVLLAASGITATNVKDALVEINTKIGEITGGSVVTGIRGESEPADAFRHGNVTITKANIGLGNVNNTADVNKQLSTPQKTYIDTELEKKQAVGDYATKTEVTTEISTAIKAVTGEDVDEAFDTLKEIADWIKADQTGTAALTQRITNIETKNTEQDTAIGNADKKAGDANTAAAAAQETADEAVEAAGAAQATADTAKATADTNAGNITKIINGTTVVGKATSADFATTATTAATATSAGKWNFARTIGLTGDAPGSASINGSEDKNIAVVLANSGVTAGSYSAVTVDEKGRVTNGAQFIEVGGSGQTSPSASLAVGGLFLKQI